jgi:hypothetical protein
MPARLLRRFTKIAIGGAALFGAGAAPASGELTVTQAERGTVTVGPPEQTPNVSVQPTPPPPPVEVESAPSPPPAEAPPPELQPTATPQPAGESGAVQEAPAAPAQSPANPQGEASMSSPQPVGGAPPVATPETSEAPPPAASTATITPPASSAPAPTEPQAGSQSTGSIPVQSAPPSPPLHVVPSPPQQGLTVSSRPTGGRQVGAGELQGGPPQVPSSTGTHSAGGSHAEGAPEQQLQGSSHQPQGSSPSLQAGSQDAGRAQAASGDATQSAPSTQIAQPVGTPASARQSGGTTSRQDGSSTDTGGEHTCAVATLHDGIGGGLMSCPGSRTHRLTLIVGFGEGASVAVERHSQEELSHVRVHDELSAGFGPAQASVHADIPLGAGGEGPSAGAGAAAASLGPKLDLNASKQGVALSGSFAADLSKDGSKGRGAKPSSGSSAEKSGSARDGAQATLDVYIPLPDLPTAGTWSYKTVHPLGSHGPALPLFLGF